jgi:Lrp/AsnC family leucine-responsive transcriptional regulator
MTVSLDRTTEDVFDKFACSVAKLEEIVECHMVGGGFDYILKICTVSMAAFRAFRAKKPSTLPEVVQTHSYFVMEEVKDTRRLVVS